MGRVYCVARLGWGWLGVGMGLGNRLFPWARARVYSHLHDARVISPVWARPALGQVLRGGVNLGSYLRQIVLLDNFRRGRGDVGVLAGALLRAGARRIPEPESLEFPPTDAGWIGVIRFEGYRGFFRPLNGWHVMLRRRLEEEARPGYVEAAAALESPFVGMCIRLGNDFSEPASMGYEPIRAGEKTPVRWFVDSLALVRRTAGWEVPAVVVSDGTDEQLRPVFAAGGVRMVLPRAAVGDLLILRRAAVALGPGSSSFFAWGAFLGQMAAATHPGQHLSEWGLENREGRWVGELDPERPDEAFLADVQEALPRPLRGQGPA